jgi:CDGSH-type Zn-finger protein
MQAAEPTEVVIKVRDSGPYKVTGPVRLVDVDGAEWQLPAGESIVLCRCGHSRSKPFCDRSHRDAGFESCERAS